VRKKKNAEGIMVSEFKLYYIATVTKTSWYQHKHTHTDQWNRPRALRNKKPPDSCQKDQKYILEERYPLQQMVLGKLNILM
jgi:hypothetical protein